MCPPHNIEIGHAGRATLSRWSGEVSKIAAPQGDYWRASYRRENGRARVC
jgi:hypothetical protein